METRAWRAETESLIKAVECFYSEHRAQTQGVEHGIVQLQLLLYVARAHSLYKLLLDCARRGCTNEILILARPLIEDVIRGYWLCNSDIDPSIEEKLFAIHYDGRLMAYCTFYDSNVRRACSDPTNCFWWQSLLDDVQELARNLQVKFARSQNPADVAPIPERKELYRQAAQGGVDVAAVEPLYRLACSAVHRDGHDLNRFYLPMQPSGQVLIDEPFGQPERNSTNAEELVLLAATLFANLLSNVRHAAGLRGQTDIEAEARIVHLLSR